MRNLRVISAFILVASITISRGVFHSSQCSPSSSFSLFRKSREADLITDGRHLQMTVDGPQQIFDKEEDSVWRGAGFFFEGIVAETASWHNLLTVGSAKCLTRMTITAWYMDDDEVTDQREPHRREGDADVPVDSLAQLGVLYWSGITSPDDPKLMSIREERGYSYTDMVYVCPEKLPDYENKIKSFYREHIHYDEEIRYCVDGSGYFDVRGANDEWIRISLEAGDMIILPEGIYHRFTCDAKNYIQALRLFVGEPVWTPYNRDEIDERNNASRAKYVNAFLKRE